jgi:dTDP-4-amino-4,6-dideoxygalactose transaminase
MTTLTYDRHKGHAAQYDVTALGYNYRIDELRSAIGLAQLNKIDALNAARRRVYRWYVELLEGREEFLVPFANRDLEQSACHIMPVLVRRDCEPVVRAALREAAIQTSRHYEPVDNFTLYRRGPETQPLFADYEIVTLPLSPAMTEEQVDFVVTTMRSATVAALRASR